MPQLARRPGVAVRAILPALPAARRASLRSLVSQRLFPNRLATRSQDLCAALQSIGCNSSQVLFALLNFDINDVMSRYFPLLLMAKREKLRMRDSVNLSNHRRHKLKVMFSNAARLELTTPISNMKIRTSQIPHAELRLIFHVILHVFDCRFTDRP